VELATGMNYLKNGRWVESKEEINILPDGTAAATQGRHQSYFPGDIYQGEIRLVTADGKTLRSRPVGLSYFDGTNSVLIAELKDSTGWLVNSNQVVYPDAFTDFKADLRYTYTKAGFEQDIILREQPPDPASFGLNPETTRLQVLTEFFNPPQPKVLSRRVSSRAGNLEDHGLSFGAMQMGQGKAFLLGTNSAQVEVNKQWLQLEGRQFLVEEVPVVSIAEGLDTLPQPITQTSARMMRQVVSKNLVLPPQRLAGSGTKTLWVAQASLPSQGLVLDYTTCNGSTSNNVFYGDATYYISGAVSLSGTNTFEGGAVIKYTNNASIALNSPNLNWQASVYRPVVFTAMDDNSVGDVISGSTGNPSTNYYASTALYFSGPATYSPALNNFRIAYAKTAIGLEDISGNSVFYNAQFINCQVGIQLYESTVNLYNALFANVQTNFQIIYGGVFAQNTTFNNANYLVIAYGGGDGGGATLTNCILANVTNLQSASWVSGGFNGIYNSPVFGTGTVTNTFYPFQSAGLGNYYLANGCNFTNKGTTNIDSKLLLQLRQKTTCPPLVYTNVISVPTTLNPQVQRDTDTPDLGYHYDPLDYIFSNTVVNANLTFGAGTAAGWLTTSATSGGLMMTTNVTIAFNGTVTAPDYWVEGYTVQEGSGTPGSNGGGIFSILNNTPNQFVQGQFTRFSALAADLYFTSFPPNSTYWSSVSVWMTNCEVWHGRLFLYLGWQTFDNCLFDRVEWENFFYSPIPAMNIFTMGNCTMHGGSLSLLPGNSPTAVITNCAFDFTSIFNPYPYVIPAANYNAYIGGQTTLEPPGANDLEEITNFNWQTGWLGNYYLPPNSPLIDAGSTNANLLGLYHFTTQTNQTVEGNSIVDIGYHYVATDSYGNPLDSNTNGTPDYIEDANGNGLVDNGETPWMALPAITVQPTNQTVFQGSNAIFSVTATGTAPLRYQWKFNGTNLVGATNTSLPLTNVQTTNVGNYLVIITNVAGSVTSSNAILTVLMPPTVSITNPVNNTTFAAPTNITINAIASDSNGTVTQVQFLVGTKLLGIKTNSPYSVIWSNAPVGIHALTAIATDNTGLTGTSSVVNVSISTNLLPIADAHVRDGSSANVNFGTNIVMECLTTNSSGNNRDIYFKFDLSNVSNNISSAKLSVFAKLGGPGSASNTVYSVTNTSWLETSITWNNKPAWGMALNTNSVTGTNWYLFDVTGYVKSQKNAGSNSVSLALHDPTNYSLLISLNSKENSTNKPSLVIVTTNSPLSISITNPVNNALFAAPAHITINASASDSDGTVTQVQFFQGTNILGVATGAPYNLAWTNVTSGTYALTARASDDQGLVSTSGVVPVVVDIPPSISLQPANQTVRQGSNAVFTVTATGTAPLSYRWLLNRTNFLAGATNATLTLTNVQLTNTGNYYSVVVTNVVGSVTSSNAVLTVLVPPSITSQPTNQTVTQGDNATFTVTAAGTAPLSYQWYFNGTTVLGTATNATLTLNSVQTNNAGTYYVVVTNAADSVTSSNAVLTVTDPPISLSTGNLNYLVGAPPKIIDGLATVSNSTGCPNFNNRTLTVSLITNVQPEDVLAINNQGTSTNQIGITNNFVTYWRTNIATFNGGRGSNALVVNFLSTPTVTAAMVQALARNITYHYYPSTNDSLANRTVQFVLSSCQGNTNYPATKNISLDCPRSLDVMLVLDCSGSMADQIGGVGTNKLAAAKTAAISFITEDMQFTNDQVGLVTFTNVAVNNSRLTNNPISVTNKINNLSAGGNTDIGDGIATAQSDFPTNGVGTNTLAVMILLTDGQPNYPTGTNATNYVILKADYAKQAGTRLITIGLGTNGDFDPNLLTRLASSPDDFIYASNTTALVPVYHSIGCSLCRPPGNQPPLVQIISPTNNASFNSGTPITITATAYDLEGNVTNVQFFSGTNSNATNFLGTVMSTNSTYNLSWTNALHGTNTLVAVATDDGGLSTTSAVVYVIINNPPMVNAGTNQTLVWVEGGTNVGVNLQGSVSDDGLPYGVTNILWSVVGSNSPVTFGNAHAAGTTATFSTNGAYTLSLQVDDGFSTNSSTCAITIKRRPFVYITSPTNNAVFGFGAPITNQATAYDLDGTVANVQFFNGTNLLGTAGANGTNYTLIWTNAPHGTNTLVAVATDNDGLSKTSAPVVIAVLNLASTVQIVSPINQTLLARSNVVISATATNATPGVTISNVEFFVNNTNSLGYAVALTNGFYERNWIPVVGGTNIFTALAVDSQGSNAWSSPVTNYVRNLPTITIISPTNGQFFSLSLPLSSTNIPISATASTNSTTITNVSFYQGTTTVGATNVGSPYVITWSNVTNGTYTLRAKANDDIGATGTSFPVNITVEPPNRSPSVYAGTNQTVRLPNGATLTGLVSDDGLPVGSQLSVQWSKVSGAGAVTLANSNQTVTSASFSTAGTYVLQLSASDSQYMVSSNVTITVLPANLAPTVNAGTNQTIILAARYTFTNDAVNSTTSEDIKSSRGKEFWLGFPQNYRGLRSTNVFGPIYLTLSVSSEVNTFVCVMIPGIGFFTNCNVSAGVTTSMYIPASAEVDTEDLVEGKGIHVVAQDEISVYGLSHEKFVSDAYCGLPVGSLGTNYIIPGWMSFDVDYPQDVGVGLDSEFLIVGTAKGTTVTITPTASDDSGLHPAGQSFVTNLDKGQTYQLRSALGELAGTIITANKPISVFAGNALAYVPNHNFKAGDILLEQIPPATTWGQEFFTAPLALRTNGPYVGDAFEVIAAVDQTTVWTNGTLMTSLMNQGGIYKFQLADPCKITADKPILLVQFANGSMWNGEPGDPFMMLIPPFEQFLTTYTVSTPLVPPETNYDSTITVWTNFVNIVVTNVGTNSICLDGGVVNPTNFSAIGDSGFSYAQVPLVPGSHHLNSFVPFGVFMYGLAWDDDSYGYPGGFSLGAVADVTAVSLSPKAATNEVATTYCLIAGVTGQSNQPVAGVRVDFQIAGSNSLTGSAYTDENGQARFCYTGTNLGVDTITASVGANTDVATNTWMQPFFTLHGSVWDDGLPVGQTNILWTQVGGPPVVGIFTPKIINPVVQVTEPGFYSFQLTADDTALTNSAQVGIMVLRNQPPSVDAGTNQITKSLSVTLNGGVTDDGLPNGALTSTWSKVSGPGTVTFGNATHAATTATFSAPGVYILRLTGDDSQAAVYSDVTITVLLDPRLLNPQPVQCGQTVNGNLISTNIHSIELTNSYADYYQFVGQSNQFLIVTMTSTNFDTYLIIRNQQLQLLAEDDDSFDNTLGSTNSKIIYCLPADGVYVIEATSACGAQTGSYAIQFECALPQEPLQQIMITSPPDGSIYPDSPADITVNLFASFTNSNYYGYCVLELYTNGYRLAGDIAYPRRTTTAYSYSWSGAPAGNYTLTAVVNGEGCVSSITSAPVVISVGWPRIVLSPPTLCPQLLPGSDTITATLEHANGNPATGNVTFTVTGANPTNATVTAPGSGLASFTYTGTNTGRDVITATSTVDGKLVLAAVEQDWAHPISCDQILSGTLTNTSGASFQSGYADYYSFSGLSNETVVITMNSGKFNPYLLALDTNCNGLMDSSGNTNGTNAQITCTLPATGDYIIEASSFLPYQTGFYSLTFQCIPPATNGTPQMAVLVNDQVVSNYATVDFGTTTVTNPISMSFTITNEGSAPLALGSISVAGDFAVTNWPTAPVPAGSSASFVVRFNASTNEFQIGQLGFSNNNSAESPFILNLSAVANIPSSPPTVTLTAPTNNSVYPFGTNIIVTVNASAFGGCSITNVQFVAAMGSNQYLIGVATNPPYTINWVNANPGNYSLFAVASDNVGRVGYSTPPVNIQILPPSAGSPGMAVLLGSQTLSNYATVNFGATTVTNPISTSFTITNEGTAQLTLGSVSVAGDFTVTNWPTASILAGSAASFTVRFNASTNEIQTGVLGFANNDSAESPFILNLTAAANIPGSPPVVALTAPTNNSVYPFGINIVVTANASTATNYTIAQVQFVAALGPSQYLIGVATNPPYTINWVSANPGNYSLFAVASDNVSRVGYSTPLVNIQIQSPNTNPPPAPPIAVDDRFTVLVNSANNILYPLANDYDSDGAPLKIIAVTTPGNHGTATIINNGTAISYTPPQGGQGYPADGFHYEISDGKGGTAWGEVLMDVYASAMPSVTLTATAYTTNAGAVDPLTATVTPSQYITKMEFYLGQTLIGTVTNGVNGVYTMNWTALYDNDNNNAFTATAYDSFGQMNTSPGINISVTVPTNAVAPVAALDSYAGSNDSGMLTNGVTIRDGLFAVYGEAFHSLGSNVVWQLGVYSADGTALLRNVAGGSNPVTSTNTPLANCDLTTLVNGVYDLRLTVVGGYIMTNTDVQFILNSNLKLGQFSFSQQDLVIPAGSLPLAVIRTYNSINPDKGDFGYSWTWALNDMDVALDETRQDTIDLDGESFSKRTGGDRDVTLTLPDGHRATFWFYLRGPMGCNGDSYGKFCYEALWKAPPGVNYTLTTIDQFGNAKINMYNALTGYWNNEADTGYEDYDFAGFCLTAPDGTQYAITSKNLGEHFVLSGYNNDFYIQAYDKPSLYQIKQRSGDTITINSNSIVHSNTNGVVTSQILLQRNSDGLITSITDPNSQALGGPPAVKYEYDANQNLMYVERLVNSSGNGTYVTNSFTYTNASFPHYITGIINADGTQVARQLFDDTGKLIGIIDANGHTNQFVHDLANRTETIFDRMGNQTIYGYDTRGNVTTEVDALGHTTQNTYDDNNNVTSTTDPLGHTTSYGYDANGYRNAITNAMGEVTRSGLDNAGRLLSKTNAAGNTTSFDYDSAGHRTKVTDALNHSTTFSHDIYGRPTAATNALNQLRATAGSDSSGNLQFVQEVGGIRMDFGHDANGNTTNTSFNWVNPNNTNQTQTLATITELDAANRVTRVTDPDGRSRMTLYDSDGRVTQSIDRMGNTNSYIYDALGNVIQTTYADGSVTRNVYDADNRVIYTDDRHLPGLTVNGNHNIYDPVGRVIRSERLANVQIDISSDNVPQSTLTSAGVILSASSTAYDDAGRVLAVTNALGAVTSYEYDDAGRQTAIIDALGNRADNIYDDGGRLIASANALLQLTRYQYDAKGRRIATIFPDNSYTTNSYNEIGQLMFVKDQAGLETDYEYDNLGRMTAVIKPQVFDPIGGTNANPQYSYQYDSYGNILSIRDPKGHQTKFNYDALGEPISRTLPLLQTNRQSYNALGQLDTSVDFKGQSNRFVYDSFGRVTTNLLYAAGSSVPSQTNVFIYDANGRLYQTIRPEGVSTFQYNIDGAVTNILSPEGRISYEYDPAMGWLTRAYTTNSDVRYGYDSLARLKTVSVVKRDGVPLSPPEVTTNLYTALGSLENVYFPNGTRSVYQYDVMNHLTNEVHYNSASQLLAQYQYTVASDGTRLASTETRLESGGTYSTTAITWSNDALRRLVKEASSSTVPALNFTNSYVYDLAGNRLWKTNFSSAGTQMNGYTYNANDQLLIESTGASSFTNSYDANGSLTNRSSASEVNMYSYNLEGRLATAAINQQQTNRYYYNQSGIRTRVEMSGSVSATNIFLNDPQNLSGFSQVLEELPAVVAAPTATYTLGSQVIAQEKSGVISYLLSDGHGSTRLLTSSSGAITDRYSYDAYGNALDFTATILNPPTTRLLYSGEQFDLGLQQYYLRARYYNPTIGRFGVQDQVDGTPDDPLNLHKYAYCQNNPVNMHDPSGNQGDICSMTFAMGIGSMLDSLYSGTIGKVGDMLQTSAEASAGSINHIESDSSKSDTATIIIHGVEGADIGGGHKYGWSKPFQNNLSTNSPAFSSLPLNHDFYEFNWGGFSADMSGSLVIGVIPVKSVHQFAFINLQTAQLLIWMKGYNDMNVISHSWGTCLAYDMLNSGGIEMHHWVTMGSPLNHGITKPLWNSGKWINAYSRRDPVVYFNMYPNGLINWSPVSIPQFTKEPFNPQQVDDPVDVTTPGSGLVQDVEEHTAYWGKPALINRIRYDLQ